MRPTDADRIVLPAASGYVVLRGSAGALPPDAGQVLLPLARAAIAAELGVARIAPNDLPWLKEHGASFITLKKEADLRGCIGTLRAHRPLAEDVRANAVAAAFRDPRFKPLTLEEFGRVSVEISVLSALEALSFTDEQDALRQLRIGTDGVVFEYGHHTSTFLPQVWESFKTPAEFLANLKHKAGLPPDFWDRDVKLMRYTVKKWSEKEEA
jgi:AmmeMemoRadiSam system protein A